ncbi:MAG: hypothetical protein JXB88_10200 [Spirochaetales bacterium]|nr:hypothetical protein [Spirochaetales bacterium]
MKHFFLSIIVFIVMVSGGTLLHAMDIRGEMSSGTRVALEDGDILFNQENGSLTFDNQVNDNLYAKLVVDFCYYNNPAGQTSFSTLLEPAELGIVYSIYPFEIGIEEAYVMYSDFLFPGLDFSIGKQRISWGTADRFNPTDILNPLNMKDPLEFGKKIPSLAFNLVWNFGMFDSFLQFVYEPYSGVARLNPELVNTMQGGLDAAYAGILLQGGLTDDEPSWDSATVETPGANIENFVIGTKAGASLYGFDLSVNYATRMNDMPYVKEIDLVIDPFPGNEVSENTCTFGYYREHEVGFDVAKDFGIFLTWAEIALFFQEEQETALTTSIPAMSMTTTEHSQILSPEPYVKYTAGLSQKLWGFFYFNIQYNHGFFGERGNEGAERLQDYLVLRTEIETLSDKLIFGLTGLGNLNNLYDAFEDSDMFQYISDNYGVLFEFDITYRPFPDFSLKAGVMLIDGKDTSTLGSMKDYDMASIQISYSY